MRALFSGRNQSTAGTTAYVQYYIVGSDAQPFQTAPGLTWAIVMIRFVAGRKDWRNIVGDLVVVIQHGGKVLLGFRRQAYRFSAFLFKTEIPIGSEAKISNPENNRVLLRATSACIAIWLL